MRVCNIEMLDNGFIVQTPETETSQGMRIASSKEEVINMVSAELDEAIAAVQAANAPAAAAPAAPSAEVIPFVADQPPVTAPVAAPGPHNGAAFGSPEYTEEMNRLLADNDRKEIKRRLDAHIADNVIEEYNKNCKAKSLLQILYNADQSAAGQTTLPLDSATAPAAPVAPAAAAPEATVTTSGDMGIPAPSGVDTGITLQQVGAALSEAGQRIGEERMAEIYALVTGAPGIGGAKPTKVSEIDPAFYQNVINQANTLA